MKSLALVFSLLVGSCLAPAFGCAGTGELLPAVGNTLRTVKTVYVKVDSVEQRVEKIATAVCAPDVAPPAFVAECSSVQHDFDEIDADKEVARQSINAAVEIYTVANEAAK